MERTRYSPSSSRSSAPVLPTPGGLRFKLQRSLSPTRNVLFSAAAFAVNATAAATGKPVQRSLSPKRRVPAPPKRTCMCSPTNHPGSFRCTFHRNLAAGRGGGRAAESPRHAAPAPALQMRRSAMANSIVRIGHVESEWARRALTALIRPSSHHLRRRSDFRPRPSRLCHVAF